MGETLRLLQEARGGSSDAFDALYARHRGRLLAFAASRLPAAAAHSVAPEDIVQETHLESARKIDSFEPQGPAAFYRWLVGIARFKITEATRAGQAKKRAMVKPLSVEPAAAQTSPSGAAMRSERATRLARALDSLPDAQAEAVRLRYLEGCTLSETAERLERSVAAVKALVSRGLGELAARFSREGI